MTSTPPVSTKMAMRSISGSCGSEPIRSAVAGSKSGARARRSSSVGQISASGTTSVWQPTDIKWWPAHDQDSPEGGFSATWSQSEVAASRRLADANRSTNCSKILRKRAESDGTNQKKQIGNVRAVTNLTAWRKTRSAKCPYLMPLPWSGRASPPSLHAVVMSSMCSFCVAKWFGRGITSTSNRQRVEEGRAVLVGQGSGSSPQWHALGGSAKHKATWMWRGNVSVLLDP